MAWSLRYLGHVWQTPWQTKAIYQKVLAIFEEVGDERGTVETLYRLGMVTAQMGDYQEAQQFYQNSLARSQKLGRQEVIMFCLAELGYIEWAFGNYQSAAEQCQESLALALEIGYPSYEATTLRYLGRITASLENFQGAKKYLKESIAIHEEIGLQGMTAEGLGELANVSALEHSFAEAGQLAQDSLMLCQELEYRAGEIVPYTVLGEVALGWGNFPEAQANFRNALQIAVEVGVPSYALHALVGMAKLLAALGEKEQALELATCIIQHPASWQWSKDCIAPLAAELETELPPEVVQAARVRGKEKNLEQVWEGVGQTYI
ncbi:MAG TPA: tetratricopeptide repeat protein [Anaerolineae bacterium]|nr:tetratricopeptide repeat protein [Anaerolineae bacterium]HMR65699.1 tetratricopeptide repeat protein [Anaerolineae bacterium]